MNPLLENLQYRTRRHFLTEGQGGQILAGGDLTLTGELSRRGGSLMAGKALSLSTPERFSVLAGGATPISIGWFGRLLARLEPR